MTAARIALVTLACIAMVVGAMEIFWWANPEPPPSRPAAMHRPNRGDAVDCLIEEELRRMDPKSIYLPENGYHWSGQWQDCPKSASRDAP